MPAMLLMDGDPEVMRYVGDGSVPDPESHERRMRGRIQENRADGLGFWSVFHRARKNDLLGTIGLVPLPDSADIELDYRLRRKAWGHGYATEAAAPCLRYAFRVLRLSEVVTLVYPANLPSQRVIAKLGFAAAGRRHVNGVDLLFYSLDRQRFSG